MGTNFIDFENPQNKLNGCELIALDTCSIINLAAGEQKALNTASIALNNDILLCYTTKSVEELHIMEEAHKIPNDKRVSAPHIQTYLRQCNFQVGQILQKINLLPNMWQDPIGEINADAINQAVINEGIHKLRWGDAMIYTLAKQNNINCIWTFDQDWHNVNDNDMTILMQGRFISNNILNNGISNGTTGSI